MTYEITVYHDPIEFAEKFIQDYEVKINIAHSLEMEKDFQKSLFCYAKGLSNLLSRLNNKEEQFKIDYSLGNISL